MLTDDRAGATRLTAARRRLLVDVTPLRESRDYRLLYAGHLVSFMGSQITVVAVPVQVYRLTGSSFAVGAVGLVQLGPLIAMSLVGGAIADAVDRRRLLLITQTLLALTSAGLALNAHQHRPALWPVYLLAAVSAGITSVDFPTRSASVPRLVRRELIPAASALGQIVMQTGVVVGPAVGGVLIARVSLASAYWVDVATFGAAMVTVVLMKPLPPEVGASRAGVASVMEGLRYLKGRRVLQGTFLIDINAMVFGMPRALFPAMAHSVFGGGDATVGLLFAAPGAGALVGALGSGWVGGVRRQGRAVIVAVVVWGLAIAGFGLVSWLPVALALLAVAGAADVISAVFRGTILQVTVPDSLRGRLSAVNIGVVTGGPRLGDAEAGAVAAAAGTRFSVVSGGVACVLGAVAMARLLPELDAYDAHAPTTTGSR